LDVNIRIRREDTVDNTEVPFYVNPPMVALAERLIDTISLYRGATRLWYCNMNEGGDRTAPSTSIVILTVIEGNTAGTPEVILRYMAANGEQVECFWACTASP
jgi:hypothetical protein